MIDVVKIGKAKPVEAVVNELRSLLEAAEAGEIRHFSIAFTVADGGVVTANFGSEEGDAYRTLGAICRLAHRLNKDLDDAARDYDFPKGDNDAND